MLVGRVLEVIDRSCHAGHLPAYLPKNHAAVRLILTYQPRRSQPVPPFYLVRTANGFFVAGGDARNGVRIFCLPSAALSARQEVRAIPYRSGGVLIATRESPQTEPSGVQAAIRSYR